MPEPSWVTQTKKKKKHWNIIYLFICEMFDNNTF